MYQTLYSKKRKKFQRFTHHQRAQHILLFAGFFICLFSGLPLKYPHHVWAQTAARMWGGVDNMAVVHLTGACLLAAAGAYHLSYLVVYAITKKQVETPILPGKQDILDLIHNFRYFLGLEQAKVQFDRYSYKQKFDYWFIVLGLSLMVGSGLLIWFPAVFAQVLPRWFIDVAYVIHSSQAVLIVLMVVAWHFYNIYFSPGTFPINLLWLHGKISQETMEREHPLELERLLRQERAKDYSNVVSLLHARYKNKYYYRYKYNDSYKRKKNS